MKALGDALPYLLIYSYTRAHAKRKSHREELDGFCVVIGNTF